MSVQRDMSITLPEFLKQLPYALNGFSSAQDGPMRVVAARDGDSGQTVIFSLEIMEPRRFTALLSLARLLVTIEFAGHSAAEQAEFLARFDRAFQRGGG